MSSIMNERCKCGHYRRYHDGANRDGICVSSDCLCPEFEAATLKELAPRSLHEPGHAGGVSVEQELNDALKAFSTPKSQPQPGDSAPAYSPQDQRNMNKLIQQNQGH